MLDLIGYVDDAKWMNLWNWRGLFGSGVNVDSCGRRANEYFNMFNLNTCNGSIVMIKSREERCKKLLISFTVSVD